MAQKKPGMMIYFEDYKALRSTLGAEEFVQMMDAMTAYAENGELPDESLLAPAALIADLTGFVMAALAVRLFY